MPLAVKDTEILRLEYHGMNLGIRPGAIQDRILVACGELWGGNGATATTAENTPPTPASKPHRKGMSAAARAKISESTTARHARERAEKAAKAGRGRPKTMAAGG